MFMSKATIVLVFGVLQLVVVENAHAYIDLSIGSMLIQALIAGLISVGIFWRRFGSYLGTLLGLKKDQ